MEENTEVSSEYAESWEEYLEVRPFFLGGAWFAVPASESEFVELSSLDESGSGDFVPGFSGSGDSLTPLIDIAKLLRFQSPEKPSCVNLSKVLKVKKEWEMTYLIFDEAGQNMYVPSWKLQSVLTLSEESKIITGVFSEGEKDYFIINSEELLRIVKELAKEKKEEDAPGFLETVSDLLESMRVNAMIYGVPLEDLFETKGEEHVVFSIRDEWFSINLRDIKEVLLKPQITMVPGVHPFVSGVMNWHGSIVSVIDLSSFLELENPEGGKWVVVTEFDGSRIGLMLGSEAELRQIRREEIETIEVESPKKWDPFTRGILWGRERIISILDVKRMFDSMKLGAFIAEEESVQ